MTTYQDLVLAKIDAEISKVEVWLEEADEVWTSETALDDARKHLGFMNALRAVVEMHEAEIRYVISEDGGSFDSEEEAIASFTDEEEKPEVTTFVVCSECSSINKSAMEDADEWVFLPEVYFPCPTFRAIGKKLGVER